MEAAVSYTNLTWIINPSSVSVPCNSNNKRMVWLPRSNRRAGTRSIVATAHRNSGVAPPANKNKNNKKKKMKNDVEEEEGKEGEISLEEAERLARELETLEEEAIGGEDEGREPLDYDRRARIFHESSRVFRSIKERDGVKE